MNDKTDTEPSIRSNRFTCPQCHELSDQLWLNAYAEPISNPHGVPLRIEGDGLELLKRNPQFPDEVREQKVAYWNRVNGGDVFLDRWAPVTTDLFVAGLEFSFCKACGQIQVWLGGECVDKPAAQPD